LNDWKINYDLKRCIAYRLTVFPAKNITGKVLRQEVEQFLFIAHQIIIQNHSSDKMPVKKK